jgi:hypothetical protein
MNCPYCNFEFKKFLVNDANIPDMAPLLCEDCLRISMLIEKRLYKVTMDQLEAIKKSPAWKYMIEPSMKVIEEEKRKKIPPVDRTQITLTTGLPVTPDHREIQPLTGMQKDYVVLSKEERSKGFMRPVRRAYTHKVCGEDTHMSLELAETYARDPGFYDGTFCATCRKHFPLREFLWEGTDEQLGT